MIVLNENMSVDIPNYDDLANKPKINGVTLEGNKTSAELGIDLDTTRYYTKTESDNRFQPKGNYQPAGNYLTSIPSEYVTETELNNTLNQKDYATKTYVDSAIENIEDGSVDLNDYYTKGEVDNLIDNVEVDLTGYATEQWVENKGYLTAVPSAYVTETELDTVLYETLNEYVTESELALKNFVNIEDLDRALTEKQDRLVSGEDIKTINGESILGSGDLIIESETTDLSNYYTKSEIDAQIGDINTILENIIG